MFWPWFWLWAGCRAVRGHSTDRQGTQGTGRVGERSELGGPRRRQEGVVVWSEKNTRSRSPSALRPEPHNRTPLVSLRRIHIELSTCLCHRPTASTVCARCRLQRQNHSLCENAEKELQPNKTAQKISLARRSFSDKTMSSSQGDALSAAVDHLHVDGNMETPARADENEQPQPRASIAVPAWLKRAMRPTIAIVNDGAATNGIEDEGDDKDGMTQGGEEEPDWLTDAYSALPDEAKRRRRTTIAPNAPNVDDDDEPAWLSTATETLQRGVRRIRKSIALVARVARLSATEVDDTVAGAREDDDTRKRVSFGPAKDAKDAAAAHELTQSESDSSVASSSFKKHRVSLHDIGEPIPPPPPLASPPPQELIRSESDSSVASSSFKKHRVSLHDIGEPIPPPPPLASPPPQELIRSESDSSVASSSFKKHRVSLHDIGEPIPPPPPLAPPPPQDVIRSESDDDGLRDASRGQNGKGYRFGAMGWTLIALSVALIALALTLRTKRQLVDSSLGQEANAWTEYYGWASAGARSTIASKDERHAIPLDEAARGALSAAASRPHAVAVVFLGALCSRMSPPLLPLLVSHLGALVARRGTLAGAASSASAVTLKPSRIVGRSRVPSSAVATAAAIIGRAVTKRASPQAGARLVTRKATKALMIRWTNLAGIERSFRL